MKWRSVAGLELPIPIFALHGNWASEPEKSIMNTRKERCKFNVHCLRTAKIMVVNYNQVENKSLKHTDKPT